MKNKRLKPQLPKETEKALSGKRISPEAFEAYETGSTEHLSPVFSFSDTCPNHFQLSAWQSDELKSLISTFREINRQTWAEVRSKKGFKSVDPKTFKQELPRYISPDLTIHEFRISGKSRIFGYRTRDVFKIIWFDRNHQVYDMS